jgi:hypothetical protein
VARGEGVEGRSLSRIVWADPRGGLSPEQQKGSQDIVGGDLVSQETKMPRDIYELEVAWNAELPDMARAGS